MYESTIGGLASNSSCCVCAPKTRTLIERWIDSGKGRGGVVSLVVGCYAHAYAIVSTKAHTKHDT